MAAQDELNSQQVSVVKKWQGALGLPAGRPQGRPCCGVFQAVVLVVIANKAASAGCASLLLGGVRP